jgi:hypothetical protein
LISFSGSREGVRLFLQTLRLPVWRNGRRTGLKNSKTAI